MAEVLNLSVMLLIGDSLYLDEENLSLTEANLSGPFGGFDVIEEEQFPYHGAELGRFHEWYESHLHNYLSIPVCVFGILANVLNIIVLTQRDMVSPTNGILTGLAVADMLVIATYLPYTITMHVMPTGPRQSFGKSVFILVHAHVSVVFHSVSTWLTVTLAVWRFLAVSFPASSIKWCSMQRARWAVISVYVSCVLCCLLQYLSLTVQQTGTPQEPSYKVRYRNIKDDNGAFLRSLNLWAYSVFMKLVPCVTVTGLSLGLLRVLHEAKARKRRLKRKASGHTGHGGGSEEVYHRTTRMLLAVLLLFLVTEFPSGILALLSGILGHEFFRHVYLNFSDLMDILALVNNAVNFILYCSMSRQFRKTFAALFTPRIVAKWFPLTSEPTKNTYATTCV